MRIADLSTPSVRLTADGWPSIRMGFVLDWGGVGPIFLGESRSRLYPHMRAKCGRDPTAGSKKVSMFIIGYLHIMSMKKVNILAIGTIQVLRNADGGGEYQICKKKGLRFMSVDAEYVE